MKRYDDKGRKPIKFQVGHKFERTSTVKKYRGGFILSVMVSLK